MDEGNGDDFVTWTDFDRFIKTQEQLCESFRGHQDTKIEGIKEYFDEKFNSYNISIFFVGAIISILTLINMYMNFIGGWP